MAGPPDYQSYSYEYAPPPYENAPPCWMGVRQQGGGGYLLGYRLMENQAFAGFQTMRGMDLDSRDPI